jgi:hypothetical protein
MYLVSELLSPVRNSLKQIYLSSLLFRNALEYVLMRVQKNQRGSELNGTRKFLVCYGDANLLSVNISRLTIKKNKDTRRRYKEVRLRKRKEN